MRAETCACGRPLGHVGPCARTCSLPDCNEPHRAKGLCWGHYRRQKRHGDVDGGGKPRVVLAPLHIEDVEWMAETGEGLEGAARRLDRSVTSLQRALERADRYDLVSRLKRNRSAAWA